MHAIRRTRRLHRADRPQRSALPALLLGPLLVLGTVAAGCGDDNDEDDATASPAGDVADTTVTTTDGADDGGAGETITVSAVDYSFEDLPASVPAGTTLALVNESVTEAHELVAFRVPDDETRSLDELLALPPEEQANLFGTSPPVAVLMAPPGEEATAMVGDGTLTEPGRYVVICSIPMGAYPDDVMAAAEASNGGPPEDIPGGPPHHTQGMAAELTVE